MSLKETRKVLEFCVEVDVRRQKATRCPGLCRSGWASGQKLLGLEPELRKSLWSHWWIKDFMKAWRTGEKWQSESQRLLNGSTEVTKESSQATAIPTTIIKNEFKIQNFRNWGCAVSVPFWILYWAPQNLLRCCHGTTVLIVNGVKWSPKVSLSLLVKWAIRAHKSSPILFKTAKSFLVSWDRI